ncbi:MAG: thioredoxin-like domain-containing protein [Candidatus Pollutiaquabacter aromativorans]|uniref:thioredoxin-like domain-containing protein n=1 Tax=Candidatus Pollutiaquabacter sp. TaxID=3416354 RepID=UPI003CAC55DA|nr:AhpC/TSA family protein [Bacteroidota bacterium]
MTTRRFLLLLITGFLSVLFACSSDTGGPVIRGQLGHAPNTTLLFQRIGESGEVTLDSVTTDADGKFSFRNPVTELDYYILRANPTNLLFLILRGGETVEINGDAQRLDETYSVKGSEDSESIRKLREYERKLTDSLNSIYAKARNENPLGKDSVGLKLQAAYSRSMEHFAQDFIRQHNNSIASLSATKYLNQQQSLPLMSELEENLRKAYPDNKYARDFSALVQDLRKLPPGSLAPEIKLPGIDGQPLALSSLRGKVVLVDFWASWCQPCRMENPNLVRIYKKYRGDKFEILGVSLDRDAAAWKAAVVKDSLSWPQISELKMWESGFVKDYNIDAIPFSVLLDANGKIIAKGLRGEDLELKIREQLGKTSS